MVSFRKSYHGSTQGALSVMGDEEYKNSFRPLLPGITQLDYNNIEQLDAITNQTACVIAEVIQAEAGVNIPDKSFLQALHKRCADTGALLIFDEIQTGMGRTGSLFAFEQWDVTPDILLTAKAFGGGLPLGAFISSQEIMWSFTENPTLGHITTFGGNPVCCAAGLAAMQVLIEEDLMKEVRKKEQLFLTLLRHPAIKEVRSAGLLIAVEFDSFETNKKIIDLCIKCGIIVDWFLFSPQCLRIAPPLTIDATEIHYACEIIVGATKKITGK
jgi:acetylornithine/succinyldiaminopimelate/putrescine aminotransferase